MGPPSRAGIAAVATLPGDAWSDRTGAAGGALAWLEVPLSSRLAITARAGLVLHAPATIEAGAHLWLLEAPVLGGIRLALPRAGRLHAIAGGDIGLVVAHERATLAGVAEGDTSLRFGADLVVGLAFDRVAVEVGPRIADRTDLHHTLGLQVTAAVRLRSW
ncbi:MAG TPA: hypothetical protein VHE35_02760 [Kofleriaceae bacterium]|nr:hypothetical protein [Kofleriaceae bacterium]